MGSELTIAGGARSPVRRDRSDWMQIFADYEQFGGTIRAFCASRGLSTKTFSNWRRRLREEQTGGFVEVAAPVSAPACSSALPSSCWDVELELGDGIVLRLRRGSLPC